MVPSARKAALRMGLAECIARAASPQALLSFRYKDGLDLESLSSPRLGVVGDKVMAGGTPANPAALAR
jgi:hypothetical protein